METETPSARRVDRPVVEDRWIAFLLFLLALAVYVKTLAPTVLFDDGGEIATAVFTGGLLHPPGYPLYTLIAQIPLHLLPIGEPAWRIGLLSSLFGATAVALAYKITRELGAGQAWSAAGAILFAFSRNLWMQSTKVETYSLNALFAAALLLLALQYFHAPERRKLYAFSLVLGLSLTNHLSILYLLPCLLILAARGAFAAEPGAKKYVLMLQAFGVMLISLLLYAYEPYAAIYRPNAQVWGDPDNWERLYLNLSGFTYNGFWQLYTLPRSIARFAAFGPAWIWSNTGPVFLLSLIGLAALLKSRTPRRIVGLALLVGILSEIVVVTLYGIPNIYEYYTPLILLLTITAAIGGNELTNTYHNSSRFGRKGPTQWEGWFGILLLLTLCLTAHWRECDNSRATYMRTYAQNLLASIPQNGVFIAPDESTLFPLWYATTVLHERPDVGIVSEQLLNLSSASYRASNEWYMKRLFEQMPYIDAEQIYNRSVDDPAYAKNHGPEWEVMLDVLRSGRPLCLSLLMPPYIASGAPMPVLNHIKPEVLAVPTALVYQVIRTSDIPAIAAAKARASAIAKTLNPEPAPDFYDTLDHRISVVNQTYALLGSAQPHP